MASFATLFDTWGEPIYSNGDPMQGPGQISEGVKLAMARGMRHFATMADMVAEITAKNPPADYYMLVANCFGFLFRTNGTGSFTTRGVAHFTDLAAATAAVTVPQTRMRIRLSTEPFEREWNGSAWAEILPTNRSIFTRASGGTIVSSGSFGTVVDFPTALVDRGHFTNSAGTFTCAKAGTYRVMLTVNVAANATGARGIRLSDNTGAERTLQLSTFNSVSGTIVLPWARAFTVGQTIRGEIQQNSGSTLAYTGEMDFELVA